MYALKRVKIVNLSAKEKENALNEIRILASIHHPGVIAYKEAFIDEASKSLWYHENHSVSSWSSQMTRTLLLASSNSRKRANTYMRQKFGVFLFRLCEEWQSCIDLTSFIETLRYTQFHIARQYFSVSGWCSQNWRHERIQNHRKGFLHDPDWYSLLR